mmetsp:Transcript_109179/g.163304  ORF Transcript_109179/g.163304 Transcript_109179/m.163304 type:complete len:128 (+) Transcript_109179:235-618(+)
MPFEDAVLLLGSRHRPLPHRLSPHQPASTLPENCNSVPTVSVAAGASQTHSPSPVAMLPGPVSVESLLPALVESQKEIVENRQALLVGSCNSLADNMGIWDPFASSQAKGQCTQYGMHERTALRETR